MEIGDRFTTYYPADELDGDHVIAVSFPCDPDWIPDETARLWPWD